MKKHSIQLILTILFGPLGLVYAKASWALFILFGTFILGATVPMSQDTMSLVGFCIWCISQYLGWIAVDDYNESFRAEVKKMLEERRAEA